MTKKELKNFKKIFLENYRMSKYCYNLLMFETNKKARIGMDKAYTIAVNRLDVLEQVCQKSSAQILEDFGEDKEEIDRAMLDAAKRKYDCQEAAIGIAV